MAAATARSKPVPGLGTSSTVTAAAADRIDMSLSGWNAGESYSSKTIMSTLIFFQ
jgi:hypothetical protein